MPARQAAIREHRPNQKSYKVYRGCTEGHIHRHLPFIDNLHAKTNQKLHERKESQERRCICHAIDQPSPGLGDMEKLGNVDPGLEGTKK